MKLTRRSFLKSSAGAGLGLTVSLAGQTANTPQVRLIRHATLLIRYGGRVILVDPMLGAPGVMPPIARSPNPRPNPLVPLPAPAETVLDGVDAILVTHTHADHWDAAARDGVRKNATLFIQPADGDRFAASGFTAARAIEGPVAWNGITISRTGGQHGRGGVGRRMAPVSGYVLSSAGWPTLYVAGDTVWCPEVAGAIETHTPEIIVVNAGAAQFLEGGPITMDVEDVVSVCRAAPGAKVIAVHMEAINHCVLTRAALRQGLNASGVKTAVLIPGDGQDALEPM